MPLKGEFRKIYVRAPNWVGDAVAATAVMREIRAAYPNAEMVIGVRSKLEPVFRGAPWFEKWMPAEDRGGWSEIRRSADELKAAGFDLAFLLPNSFRSALPPFLAGISHRVGYKGNGRGFLLTRRLAAAKEGFRRIPVPMIYSYGNLLGLIGVAPQSIKPELFVDSKTEGEMEKFLADRGIRAGDKYCLVSPGASYGSSKLWKPEAFAAVVDGLQDRFQLKSVVHCGPGEEQLGKDIEQHARHKPARTYDSLRDLHQLKAIAKRSSLLVTTDSGPRHYGVAFNKPIVCLMGPTSPLYTHANMEKTELVRVEVDCGPCQLKTCPLDHRCMEQITPHMVLDAAGRVLKLS